MSNQIVVLSAQDTQDFTVNSRLTNKGIQWLLKNLTVKEDIEQGIEPVDVIVRATEDGTLFDVFANEQSVGFNTVRAFCFAHKDLKLPNMLFRGDANDIAPDGYVLQLVGGN